MKRDEILIAAAGVFAQHGFRGSTTRRIADAAGVNEITIFRQFGSKEALIREAMQHLTQAATLEALPQIPVDPPRELSAWSASFMQHLGRRSSIIRKTMGEMEERPEMCECASYVPTKASNDLCDYLNALRRQGRTSREFDPKMAAAMLMGAIFAEAMGRDIMPEVYPRPASQTAHGYATLLLQAIGVENAPRRTTYRQKKRPKQPSS